MEVKMSIFVIFCLMNSLCHVSTSSTSPPAQDIAITSSAQNIQSGFTKNLDINCTFKQDANSEFGFLSSLMVLKTDTPEDTDYKEIASVNSIHPDTVTSTSSLAAQVSGQLNSQGESFISFHWLYPANDVEGQYKCFAFGLDKSGHQIESSATTMVREKSVDLAMILEKMKNLEIDQDHIKTTLNKTQHELNNTEGALAKTREELNKTETTLTKTRVELNKTEATLTTTMNELNKSKAEQIKTQQSLMSLQTRVNTTLSGLFENSKTFRNHTYLMGFRTYLSVVEKAGVCELMGGYLVEINDQQEYTAVANLIKSSFTSRPNGRGSYALVGMTDVEKEGEWKFSHSGDPVTFFKWHSSEPTRSHNANCVVLSMSNQEMYDTSCFGIINNFICEIE